MKHELIVKPKAKQDIVDAASSYTGISNHYVLAVIHGHRDSKVQKEGETNYRND